MPVRFISKSNLYPYENINGDKVFNADELTGMYKKIRVDGREGSAAHEMPEGLPVGYVLEYEIPAYTADFLFTLQIGDTVTEKISNPNGVIDDGKTAVSGLAGEFSFEKTSDTQWTQRKPITYLTPVGYPVLYEVEVDYDGSAQARTTITTLDGTDYQIDWGDGAVDTAASGVEQSHNYASTYQGKVKYIFGENQRPERINMKGNFAGDLAVFMASMNRYQTLHRWTLIDEGLKFTGNVEEMAIAVPNSSSWQIHGSVMIISGDMEKASETVTAMTELRLGGAAMDIGGDLGKIAANSPNYNYWRLTSNALRFTGDIGEIFAGAPNLGSFWVSGTGINITGDIGAAGPNATALTYLRLGTGCYITGDLAVFTAGAVNMRQWRIASDQVEVTGDLAQVFANAPNTTICSFLGDKMALSGDIAQIALNSPGANAYELQGDLMTVSGDLADALANRVTSTYWLLTGPLLTVGGDIFQIAANTVTAKYIYIRGGTGSVFTVSAKPVFTPTPMRAIGFDNIATQAEVDLFLEGAAGVPTWGTERVVRTLGASPAPSITSTQAGGWIEQITTNGATVTTN